MNRLKTMRISKGITQKEICEKLNINQANYSRYENNKLTPTVETLIELSNYYQVSIDYLLGRKNKNDDLKSQLNLIIDYIEEIKKTI